MQAMMNIEVLNAYEAKKIVACPHCFNTLKMNIRNWAEI
jgi:Fe-S oxidoreductase